MSQFVHLHVHSEYSALDGMGKVRELIETAKSFGQPALAITDHGSTSGLLEAQHIGDELGVKIIHGNEFYYERENDGKNGHLLVLAKNNKGLENIFKLQEYSYTKNFYYKPRIDWDILKHHSEGLVTTSTCLGSAFNQMIVQGDIVGATNWAKKFKEKFKGDFFIEIQPNDIPEQFIVNEASIRIARELNLPIVATNDVHYTFENDCFPHEVLLAMQVRKKMSDEKRFRFPTDGFHLKSEEEMRETFHGVSNDIVEEALRNTRVIADMCNARIEKGKYLPNFYSIPEGKSERELLEEKVNEGLVKKGFANDQEYVEEAKKEIDIIDRNGYSGYFLIVQDYVGTARENGIIVGDGRGSGAGSKVAFLTDITRIEPKAFDLLFERFMADGRSPDFDVDFSDQDAVFEDLQRKYGVENVARIIAFGRMTPRAVIRKVLSTFEVPMDEIGRITKLVPELCPSLEKAYNDAPELLNYKKKYHVEWEVIERLENVISHESTHAGGVIICKNLSSVLPIKTSSDDRTKRIVAWDMDMVESIGHYKFDILGLKTLPVIQRTLQSIKENLGIEIDLHQIDYEDEKVYDMLSKGDVSGVFQLNNQAQKVMTQKPRSFRDLIAINALIRPGVGDWDEYIARRGGKAWDKDPLRPWMHETFGTMTYQEQFLLDAHHLAGWSIADADKWLRKNKDIRNDKALKEKFIHDALMLVHKERFGDDYLNVTLLAEQYKHTIKYFESVWAEIEDAVDGGYSFNKSHSASYAMLSYQTAYLKCYYPAHFYASLMTNEGDDQDAIAKYISECKERKITITPPDINRSTDDFVVSGDNINYRITTIRHVGESAINHINSLRPILSFRDFMERRERKHIKKNVLVNLIKAGCFDFDNPNRAELLWEVDMSERTKTQIKEGYECPRYEYNDVIKSEWEKEALGLYLSIHPMEKYSFKPFTDFADGEQAFIGGQVSEVVVRKDKRGNDMAFVTIDTLHGSVRVLVFSSLWQRKSTQSLMQEGKLIVARGKRSGDALLFDSGDELQ